MVVMSSGRPSAVQAANQVVLRTSTTTVTPSKQEKLLGCIIQSNCKWTEYIRCCKENNLISSLNKRDAALKKIGQIASFQQRKFFGKIFGIFMSKIS